MRHLRVVALSSDGRQLLLAGPDAERAGYRLDVDERLARALRGEPLDLGDPVRQLSPKEIQARLRTGASPEQVAAGAGVPLARVLRYATPVLDERARVVGQVQAATLSKPRAGTSRLTIGRAVERWLADTPQARADEVEWTAARSGEGAWTVTMRVPVRGRLRTATWLLEADGSVVALDPLAATAGFRGARPAAAPAVASGGAASPARPAPGPAVAGTLADPATRPGARRQRIAAAPADGSRRARAGTAEPAAIPPPDPAQTPKPQPAPPEAQSPPAPARTRAGSRRAAPMRAPEPSRRPRRQPAAAPVAPAGERGSDSLFGGGRAARSRAALDSAAVADLFGPAVAGPAPGRGERGRRTPRG